MLNSLKAPLLIPTWLEHATSWSGVRRATIAPRNLLTIDVLKKTCCHFPLVNAKSINRTLCLVAWPSGLRRWFKAPVSSEAWVRIPPLPDFESIVVLSNLRKKSNHKRHPSRKIQILAKPDVLRTYDYSHSIALKTAVISICLFAFCDWFKPMHRNQHHLRESRII